MIEIENHKKTTISLKYTKRCTNYIHNVSQTRVYSLTFPVKNYLETRSLS